MMLNADADREYRERYANEEEEGECVDPNPLDTELLMERAEAGWKLLRSDRDAHDAYEVLAAIVWPSPEAVQAQLTRRAELGIRD